MSELFQEPVPVPFHAGDIPSIRFPVPDAGTPSPIHGDPNSSSAADDIQQKLWNGLSSLYDSNLSLQADAAALDRSSKKANGDEKASPVEVLNDLIDTFMNGANTVLNELTMLGNVHPVLAIAIFAFHEVVKLDIARRDNNKKVLVVVMQMQNMLCPMFQLRNLDHKNMSENEKAYHENRLQELMEVVTQDIKMCRSDITHFVNRKFVYKLVLARGYERKFASHIETFAQRRSELHNIISEYVAVGISNANKAIHSVGTKVDIVDEKLDKIITALFRNVDTPREKDVLKFFEQNGGPKKCVENSDLLPKLISKAGESPKTGKIAISSQAELEEVQKELIEAINEDLDKVLDKHFLRFEKVLQVQSNNMKRMSTHLEDQGLIMQTHTTKLGKILDTVTTIMVLEEGKFQTKAVKLKDPEIQRVWRQMNLTGSVVKARVFVLTFRDHIRADNSNLPTPGPVSIPLPGSSPEDSNSLPLTTASKKEEDDWVLEYIDVAYVQPIVEAIDEDGSGFISVQEANRFALARPEGMSLLHWIAYWAAGWHHNLTKYQKEIYEILLNMNDALPNVHVANRVYVDDYLDQKVMSRVEALLRSIRTLPQAFRNDRKLVEIAEIVAAKEMKQLEANFQAMGCIVETSSDATTIAGDARVETWILPLIRLLLRRHLDIIHLSKTTVLDQQEFLVHSQSLESVFSVFDDRLQNLEAKFRQLHNDVDAQFINFSYGMFNVAYKKKEFNVFDNTLMTLKANEYPHSDCTPATVPDKSILSKPLGQTLDLVEVDFTPPNPPPENHVRHPMEGEWFGWFTPWANALKPSYLRPYHCVIHPIVDNKIVGKATGFFGSADITGSVETTASPEAGADFTFRFKFLPSNDHYLSYTCQGTYNEERDTIEGGYDHYTEPEVPPEPSQKIETSNGAAEGSSEPETGGFGEGQPPDVALGDRVQSNDLDALDASNAPNTDSETDSQSSESATDSSSVGETEGSGIAEPEAVPIPESQSDSAAINTTTSDVKAANSVVEDQDTEPNATGNTNNDVLLNNTEPEQEGVGRLHLRRTPAHLFRFRRYIDGIDMPPCWRVWPIARKRWAFAIAATLSETRARMNSRKIFNEALIDRRKWLYCAMRYDQKEPDITTRHTVYDRLTDEEWDLYDYLLTTLPPTIGYIYEELAHYMARREAYLIKVGRAGCDLCHWNLSFTRHQCIYCMEDDMSDYMDLCHNCLDKPALINDRPFSHSKSHSLLRSPSRIHIHEFNAIIPQVRLISERSKKMFRDLEEQSKINKQRHSRRPMKERPGGQLNARDDQVQRKEPQPELSPILCAICNEVVTLPCWVCAGCSPLTFFCLSCEKANHEIILPGRDHDRSHRILRIQDSVEVKSVRQNQMSDVGRQLEDINSTIAAIDSKLNKQAEDGRDMKGIVDDVAKKVGAWNDIEATASVRAWIDEQNHDEITGTDNKNDAPQEGFVADENSKDAAPRIHPENDKLVLDVRMATLEVKVEDISTKIDGMEQKLNALFTLVQSFIESRTSPNGLARQGSV